MMNKMASKEPSTLGDPIDDYARAVGSRWRWMVLLGLVGALVGIGLTVLPKPLYQAKTTLLLPNLDPKTSLATSLGGFSPVNVLRGLATSLEVQRRVAAETGVPRVEVEASVSAKAELNQNQLEISATQEDPKVALQLVQSVARNLEKVASETGLGSSNRQATILRAAIQEREKELEVAVERLVKFEQSALTRTDPADPTTALVYRQRLTEVEVRLKAVNAELAARRKQIAIAGRNPSIPSDLSGAIAERSALLDAEFSFETARLRYGPDSPELQQRLRELEEARQNFEREVSARFRAAQQGLDTQIASLEARRAMYSVQRDFWRRLVSAAPEEAIKLIRLNFEVESLETVLKGLRDRYDDAVVGGGVDTMRWSELSPPQVMRDPVNKNYGLNTFLGLMVGLFLGGAISIAKHGY